MSGYFWSLRTLSALNTKCSIKAPWGWQMGSHLEKASPSLMAQLPRGQIVNRQVNSPTLFLWWESQREWSFSMLNVSVGDSMWPLAVDWQGSRFFFFFTKYIRLIALVGGVVSIWRLAINQPQTTHLSCHSRSSAVTTHRHTYAAPSSYALSTQPWALAVRLWNITVCDFFFLLIDEHLVYDSPGPNKRFTLFIFSARLMLTKAIHPSPCPQIKVLYSYIIYFIKINFQVGIIHHPLTSLNVTES